MLLAKRDLGGYQMQLADRLVSGSEHFFYWTHFSRCLRNPCDGNGASFCNTTFRSSDKVQKSMRVLSKSFILCAVRLHTKTRPMIQQSAGTALLHLLFLLLQVIKKNHPPKYSALLFSLLFFSFEPTFLYKVTFTICKYKGLSENIKHTVMLQNSDIDISMAQG